MMIPSQPFWMCCFGSYLLPDRRAVIFNEKWSGKTFNPRMCSQARTG